MPEEDIAESAEVAIEAVEDACRNEEVMPKWVLWASLSTMVMALCSALGGLLAGKTANEALIDRQQEIHDLIKLTHLALEAELLRTRVDVLGPAGDKTKTETLVKRIQVLERELPDDTGRTVLDFEDSDTAFHAHEVYAIATTVLSGGITLTGMAIIVRRKEIWLLSLAIAFVGAALLAYGFVI